MARAGVRAVTTVAAGLAIAVCAVLVVLQIAQLVEGRVGVGGVAGALVAGGVIAALARLVPTRRLLAGWTAVVVVFLFAPIMVVVVYAFNDNTNVAAWGGFTTRWFSAALADETITSSVWRSLRISLAASAIAVIIGTAAALALANARARLRGAYEALVFCTIVVPELVVAIGLLVFFVNAGFALGETAMTLGHAIFGTSLVTLVVQARVVALDRSTAEASADLGATSLATFRQVTLPQLTPAIAAGGLLAFTLSFDDVVISQFTSGAGSQTWPLRVLAGLRFGLRPDLNATATLMLAVTLALLLVAALIARAATRRGLPPAEPPVT